MSSLRPTVGLAGALLAVATLPYLGFHLLARAELRTPLGLLAGGLSLPLIVLHMLRVQLPQRAVGSLLLWRQAVPQPSGARPFQRLRRNLPLLLQLLALGALTYALAGPVVGGFSSSASAQVLVLDVSASMGARDEPGGGTRLERAQDQARALLDALEAGAEATVIAVDRDAVVLCPWTDDRRRLRAALENLRPRAAGTNLAQALRLVAAVSGNREPDVHLLSDGGGRAPGDVPFPGTLHYHPQGDAPPNVGIVATDLKPLAADDASHEVYARVLNEGPAREVFLGLVSGERLLAARSLQLASGATQAATFRLPLREGVIELRLLADANATPLRDALSADDRAWLRVARPHTVTCALQTEAPQPMLERGLRVAGASLGPSPTTQLSVSVGAVPSVAAPDALSFAPPAAVGPVAPGLSLTSPQVVAWDREHPLLQHVELGDLRLATATALVLGPAADPLVFARGKSGGESVPVVAAFPTRDGMHVVVGFDPEQSSWPKQVSFPVFLRNVIRQSEDRLRGGGASAVRAGGPVSVPVGEVTAVTLSSPDGTARQLPAVNARAVFDSSDAVGVYQLTSERGTHLVCVNLAEPGESATTAQATLDVGARPVSVQAAGRTQREVAWWFALIACAILAFEAWAYHRRL